MTGRPTLYDPVYCDRIKEMAAKGMSVAEWAAELGVARSTLYLWADDHSEFMTALRAGKDLEQAAWERMARENLDNKNFNANLWIKSAQARFREDYTERREVETNGNVNFSGLPSPTIAGIQFKILDPAKLPTDDLEQLAEMIQRQQSPVIDHEITNPEDISNKEKI